MPKKKVLPDRGIVRVTFELPAKVTGTVIHLVGDFTGWEGTPMEKQPEGSWRTTVDLAPGGSYEFRYLIDGVRWENDWDADAYVSNAYGQENSVVRTPPVNAGAAQKSAAKKSAAKAATGRKSPAKKSPAKKAAAKKSPAKAASGRKSPAKKSSVKSAGKKSAAKGATGRKSAAKGSAGQTSPTRTSPAKKATPTKAAATTPEADKPTSQPAPSRPGTGESGAGQGMAAQPAPPAGPNGATAPEGGPSSGSYS
jgi:hypothetical protein